MTKNQKRMRKRARVKQEAQSALWEASPGGLRLVAKRATAAGLPALARALRRYARLDALADAAHARVDKLSELSLRERGV